MSLSQSPKAHRFPMCIISQAIWRYHRFNDSYRDISEDLAYRGIIVSYEAIRGWCVKFSKDFKDVIKKRERKPRDKWHLGEMIVKMNGKSMEYLLCRCGQLHEISTRTKGRL